MATRADKIIQLVKEEVQRRQRALEADDFISEVEIIVRFDRKTGEPGRISYRALSENYIRPA